MGIMTGQVTLRKERLKTVRYYAEVFMESKRQITAPKTHERYSSIIDNVILPCFGDNAIKDLKVSQIEKWRNDLLKRLSAKTVKDYQSVLRGIFQKALHDEEIGRNPMDALDTLKVKKPDVVPFMPHEVKLLLETANGWFKNYLALGFMTGMRVGEIIALKWENVNFDKREIYVCASISMGIEGSPKTQSSIRYVPIMDSLLPFLEDQRRLNGDKEYVFVNRYGQTFYDYTTIGLNQWTDILKECGLTYRRMYEMRHTCATNLLMSGQYSVNEIAAILGHSTPQMLFERYTRNISAERKPFNKSIDIYGVNAMAL
jgi:integrase